MNTETDTSPEPDNRLCYEYRMYDPEKDIVTYHLTYDRALAYTHDQFAIPLYVQTVEVSEKAKGVLLHDALRALSSCEFYLKISGTATNTYQTVQQTLNRITKTLKNDTRDFGKHQETKTGNGALHVDLKNTGGK